MLIYQTIQNRLVIIFRRIILKTARKTVKKSMRVTYVAMEIVYNPFANSNYVKG